MSKMNEDVGMTKVNPSTMVCKNCKQVLPGRMDICKVFQDHKPPRVFGGKSCPFKQQSG